MCHAVRWQGTGSDEVSTRDQKSKNPDNLLQSWRNEKINGAHLKLHRSCCSMQGV
ncbi:DNA replication protein [Klebsiella pneumoniae subsp. pneumoniae]|nr:DNA replication protein [Klebsiella pneumoniae subsp. pneumoniae]